MRHDDHIRCWKDPDYRDALAGAGRAVPPHPAGAVELPDEDLAAVVGGQTEWLLSFGCCGGFTDVCPQLTHTIPATLTLTIITTSQPRICPDDT